MSEKMQKQADGLMEGFGDLGKAITYIVLGASAATGAGLGVLADKVTEPTDTDMGNARKAYSIADLRAAIMTNKQKLETERGPIKKPKKSMWGIL